MLLRSLVGDMGFEVGGGGMIEVMKGGMIEVMKHQRSHERLTNPQEISKIIERSTVTKRQQS